MLLGTRYFRGVATFGARYFRDLLEVRRLTLLSGGRYYGNFTVSEVKSKVL